VAGDFNIELQMENKAKDQLLSLMSSFNLLQTVFENTRVFGNSSSCIDNVFTNQEYVSVHIFENFVSDHRAQKITIETDTVHLHEVEYKRFFTIENKKHFVNSLLIQDWETVYKVDHKDVNAQWDTFLAEYMQLFNQCFPYKSTKQKNRINKSY